MVSKNSSIDVIPVPVANGGSGAATLTGVLTGNGTSAITANAVTQHGILIAGASNAVSSLGVAATGTILAGSTGADPAFTATPSGLTSLTATSLVTSSATLGTTYTNNTIEATGSDANIDIDITPKGTGSIIYSASRAADNLNYQVTNSDNTNGASTAGFQAAVGGATAGDPYVQYAVSGVTTWTTGIDNSVSDNYVIAASSALGTSNAASWSTAGALTNTAGITASAGDIAASSGNLSASGTVTGGTGVTATTGNVSATAGAVNAGTSMTATLGDITATNGNFVSSTAAKGVSFVVSTGSGAAGGTVNCNGRVGSVTFTGPSIASGATQSLVVGNTSIAGAGTHVLYSMTGATTGAAPSIQSVTNAAGTSTIVVTNGTSATMVTQTGDLTFNFIVLD